MRSATTDQCLRSVFTAFSLNKLKTDKREDREKEPFKRTKEKQTTKNTTQHKVDNGFRFFDLFCQWQKDKTSLALRMLVPLPCPLLPT